MPVYPIPDGYPNISPFLLLRDAAAAMEFYQRAFGAIVHRIDRNADGSINTVEMVIGTSMIMFSQSQRAKQAAPTFENLPTETLYLYVEDVDAVFEQALAAGATVLNPPKDQPYGDRRADLVDPFGVVWWVASRIEVVSPEEVQRRAQEAK